MNTSVPLWVSLLPLIGVAVGWLLNEIGATLRRRLENKKPLGRALVHLLEIHHWLSMYQVFSGLGAHTDIDVVKKMMRQLKFGVPTALPLPEDFEKSYAETVAEIAGISPLLAYELTGKVHIRTMYVKIRDMIQQGPIDNPEAEFTEAMSDIVTSRAIRTFEELILDVAKKFGRKEYRSVRYHINDRRERLNALPATLKKQMAATKAAIANSKMKTP
jgi:hypothetical protein